ncbi:MAG TPA: hypothetical protein VF881_18850 [Polyangiaceae bacterium]
MRHSALAYVASLLSPFLLGGCLSNSYAVERGELMRLAALEPEERWQSVRAVQRVGGDDYPPEYEPFAPPPPEPAPRVYVSTVVVHSHHHYYGAPPPPLARPERVPATAVASSTPGSAPTTPARVTSSPPKKGNGDAAAAVAVAAAVVVGAGAGFALAASEGARYDGWVAVSPDEPVFLKLPSGQTKAVQLSALSRGDAVAAESGTLYEGEDDRFPRLGRAPLNRAGFTFTTGLHMGGFPQVDGRRATAFGGYLLLGGNIANRVTLGVAGTADGGIDSKESVLLATVAPELQIYPTRYVGLYGGYGWSFRNTDMPGGTRADQGSFFRAGVVGELPLTTRLTLQARAGATEYFFGGSAPLTWEGLIGLSIY